MCSYPVFLVILINNSLKNYLVGFFFGNNLDYINDYIFSYKEYHIFKFISGDSVIHCGVTYWLYCNGKNLGECRFKSQGLIAMCLGSMSLTVLLKTLLPHPCRALLHRVCVKALHKTVYGKQSEHCKALQI